MVMGRVAAAAAAVALATLTGCAPLVDDPRAAPSEAEAIERAAYAPGTSEREGEEGEAPHVYGLLTEASAAADHPDGDLWGPSRLAIYDDGDVAAEWDNRDELWNAIIAGVADACRQEGSPLTEPIFDDPEPLHAAVDAYWNNRSTGGRGTLVWVMCSYRDPERGPLERYEARLIATDPDTLEGQVAAESPAWRLPAADFDGMAELVRARDEKLAEWVREQPEVPADPVDASDDDGMDDDTPSDTPTGEER